MGLFTTLHSAIKERPADTQKLIDAKSENTSEN
jgi:hypothetical protein